MIVATLIGVAYLTGCVTQPTTLHVERTITNDDGEVEKTVVKAEAIPHDVKDVLLKWGNIVTLKIGDATVVQPDYEAIANVVDGVIARNPISCPTEGD